MYENNENVGYAPVENEDSVSFERDLKKKIRKATTAGLSMSILGVILPLMSPLGAIVGIFLSFIGAGTAKKAEELADGHGLAVGGATTAARSIGLVGKVLSIYYTISYALSYVSALVFLVFYFAIIILSAMAPVFMEGAMLL